MSGIYLGMYLFTEGREEYLLDDFLLLFVLGLSIGSNPLIVENLWSFGWQAIVFALLTITGSLLASLMVFRLFFKKGGSDEK